MNQKTDTPSNGEIADMIQRAAQRMVDNENTLKATVTQLRAEIRKLTDENAGLQQNIIHFKEQARIEHEARVACQDIIDKIGELIK